MTADPASDVLRDAELHRRRGDLPHAALLLRDLLQRVPDERRARIALALMSAESGQPEQAAALFRDGLALDPAAADLWFFLGHVAMARGWAAVGWTGKAVRLRPDEAGYRRGLARALAAVGSPEQALVAYAGAAVRAADRAGVLVEMAALLRRQGRADAAAAALRQAIRQQPDAAAAYRDLSLLLQDRGQPGAARAAAMRACRLAPADDAARVAHALADLANGDVGAAVRRVEAVLARDPANPTAQIARVFVLDFDPAADLARQQAARRALAAALPASPAAAHANPADPERRLRVGYVSPDFRTHSVSEVVEAVLLRHDPAAVVPLFYSDAPVGDAVTERFRAAGEGWRDSARWSDEALAAAVRQDGIDILVDLAMHTAGNRLAMFRQRPAPVQVTAWGHLGGTGLAEIDALLSDPVAIPPADRSAFSEQVIDLPCWIPFTPPRGWPDPVARPPRPFTFGSFSRLPKLLPSALPAWAEILRRAPGSRLLLKTAELGEAATAHRLLARFAAAGVAPERIELLPFTAMPGHLADYGRIDLALDPFPHGGGVTTLQALWMDVPVLALRGTTPAGRGSAAILAAVGLHRLVAESLEDYVGLAVRLAGGAAPSPGSPRAALLASPLADRRYVRAVEAAYRGLWRDWCRRRAL